MVLIITLLFFRVLQTFSPFSPDALRSALAANAVGALLVLAFVFEYERSCLGDQNRTGFGALMIQTAFGGH